MNILSQVKRFLSASWEVSRALSQHMYCRRWGLLVKYASQTFVLAANANQPSRSLAPWISSTPLPTPTTRTGERTN